MAIKSSSVLQMYSLYATLSWWSWQVYCRKDDCCCSQNLQL